MTAPAFVLVHSPLVGPSTWKRVAARLSDAGHDVSMPSLLSALENGPPFASEFARLASTGAPRNPWLVGHSGAGQFLPEAALLCGAAGVVFVDAGLPHPGRSRLDAMPPHLMDDLETDPEGFLPPWPEWFGRDVLRTLIEDERTLDAFVAECPPLPFSMFAEVTPDTPATGLPSAYLRLSAGYADDARVARALGWPTIDIDGHHLWPIDHPDETTQAILELTSRT